jgi:hypothetical protein
VDARRADEVEYAPFPGTADPMEHLYDYLEFLAKAATIVVAIVAVVVAATSLDCVVDRARAATSKCASSTTDSTT